jgi:hypothetical protein
MERMGKISELDRSFDYEFWAAQTAEMKMAAIWEMVVFSHALKEKDPAQLRLNRAVGSYGKIRGEIHDHRRVRRRISR